MSSIVLLALVPSVGGQAQPWWVDHGLHALARSLGPQPHSHTLGHADTGGKCPEEPLADAAWKMVDDGACHKSTDGVSKDGEQTLAYRLTCTKDGDVKITYLQPTKKDGPEYCNKTRPINATIPAGYCWGGLATFAGNRFSCGSGGVTLYGWTAAPPHFNETTDSVTTRDGVQLTTQTVFPASVPFPPTSRTKVATMYVQTPYDSNSSFSAGVKAIPQLIAPLVKAVTGLNFNVAITLQQTRGLYTSSGNFDNGNHTKDDAGDSGLWLNQQSWSNGVVMTQGASAMGMMALLAAGANPHLVTRASWLFITTNSIREAFFRQGALMQGIMGAILLPGFVPPSQVPRAPLALHEGDGPDPFWDPVKFDDWSSVSWPSVHKTSWFDMFQKGGLRSATNMYDHARCAHFFGCSCTLLVDALGHAGLHSVPNCFGCFPYNTTAQGLIENYHYALGALLLFTYQGATNSVLAAGLNVFWAALTKLVPEKIVFVLGSGGNYLTSFNHWPKVDSQPLYLAPNASLSSGRPATTSNTSFVYDPSDPAPTYGGWYFQDTNPNDSGSVDQSPLLSRKDVIHFDGQPLDADLPLCGPLTATLTVGSTANDTDFIVRLVDQYPTGERYLVAEGVIRMRWRTQTLTPVPMALGEVYEVEIDMWNVCWIFAAGHRVGVDITSSSRFMYLPNPNTGLPLETDGIWPAGGEFYKGKNITATNSIVIGPSKLTLPVVSKSDLPVIDPLIIPSPTPPPADEELMQMGRRAMQYGERHALRGQKLPHRAFLEAHRND